MDILGFPEIYLWICYGFSDQGGNRLGNVRCCYVRCPSLQFLYIRLVDGNTKKNAENAIINMYAAILGGPLDILPTRHKKTLDHVKRPKVILLPGFTHY